MDVADQAHYDKRSRALPTWSRTDCRGALATSHILLLTLILRVRNHRHPSCTSVSDYLAHVSSIASTELRMSHLYRSAIGARVAKLSQFPAPGLAEDGNEDEEAADSIGSLPSMGASMSVSHLSRGDLAHALPLPWGKHSIALREADTARICSDVVWLTRGWEVRPYQNKVLAVSRRTGMFILDEAAQTA